MNLRLPLFAILALAAIRSPAMADTDPAAATPAPVKIGILTDEAGPYAENGGVGNMVAARLAVADYGGKVLGRPIALQDADHKNDPTVGGAILKQWFDEAGIDAVAGLSTSSVALIAQEIAGT